MEKAPKKISYKKATVKKLCWSMKINMYMKIHIHREICDNEIELHTTIASDRKCHAIFDSLVRIIHVSMWRLRSHDILGIVCPFTWTREYNHGMSQLVHIQNEFELVATFIVIFSGPTWTNTHSCHVLTFVTYLFCFIVRIVYLSVRRNHPYIPWLFQLAFIFIYFQIKYIWTWDFE